MGYALFTARKLALTTRLNTCNANLMVVSQKGMNLTQSIYEKQSAMNLETATTASNAYQAYSNTMSQANLTDAQKTQAEAQLKAALAQNEQKSAAATAELQALNIKQTAYDLEKKRLETELNAYNNELENVKKAETDAIKNSTPKFK